MKSEEFWQLRFVGRRFDDHSLPLQVLPDLAVLEELLYATATFLFCEEHPDRKRSPRGFRNSISLSISDIKQGSAMPAIMLNSFASDELFPSDNKGILEKAKNKIISIVEWAENGAIGNANLPDHLLRYFNRLGRWIKDDEYIEFAPQNTLKPAKLTVLSRKKLIAASGTKEYSEEISIRGKIPAADQGKKTFTLLLSDGIRVEAPLGEHIKDDILSAFNAFAKNGQALVHGIANFSSDSTIKSFSEIEYVELLDDRDITARLEEIALLTDGWLDGKGKGFKKEQLLHLNRLFDSKYPDALPLPYLYPTAEGGIQAEWDGISKSVVLEITLGDMQAEYRCFSKGNDGDSKEANFKLTEPKDWDSFVNTLTIDLGEIK